MKRMRLDGAVTEDEVCVMSTERSMIGANRSMPAPRLSIAANDTRVPLFAARLVFQAPRAGADALGIKAPTPGWRKSVALEAECATLGALGPRAAQDAVVGAQVLELPFDKVAGARAGRACALGFEAHGPG